MARNRPSLPDLGYWIFTGSIFLITVLSLIVGVGFSPVLTNSMAPDHPAGSVVITIQVPSHELEVGDVVKLPLPSSEGQSYIHRVVDVTPYGESTILVTKGDNNVARDPWVLEVVSSTSPLVVATIPVLGALTAVTGYRSAQLLLGVLAFAFVAIAVVRAFWRPLRNPQRGKHRADTPEPS
jgi:signal peptidase I